MRNLFNDARPSGSRYCTYEWIVADLSRTDFGAAFKDEDMEDAVVLQDHALVEYEGDIVYAVRVNAEQKADWIKTRESSKGDARLLGDHQKALDLMTSVEFADWPLSGPRATMELLHCIREGTSDLTTYHLQWVRNSGVSSFSACLHEHRCICDYLRCLFHQRRPS